MANYLDKAGVSILWDKVKDLTKVNVTDKLGKASGIATLDTSGKLTSTQLPVLKTVNGNSIVGSGDITLDLSIYKVVTALPTTNIDSNKIYLVLTDGGGIDGDLYTEYSYVNNKWEKFGQYKAEVDLTDYVKRTELQDTITSIGVIGTNADVNITHQNFVGESTSVPLPVVSAQKAGILTSDSYNTIKQVVDNTQFCLSDDLASFTSTPSSVSMKFSGMYVGSASAGRPIEAIDFPVASSTQAGVISTSTFAKINGIEAAATADSAITQAELDALLV